MNTFGRLFRVHIFGESHGQEVGVIIDGCPPGIDLSAGDMNHDLQRRMPSGIGTTARKEKDEPIIRSGIYKGKTTGAPILISFENRSQIPAEYKNLDIPRPGHADHTASVKYNGFNDPGGGGMFSGRSTVGLVAAGVVAKKIIGPVSISSRLLEAGGSPEIEEAVRKAIQEKDSIGGIIECSVSNVQPGLGEPFFDSVESLISHAVFSVPGIRGIEFGAGFDGTTMKGSEFNDPLIDTNGTTSSNNSGGINGGITNGNEIIFRVAVRPTASIGKAQKSINMKTGKMEEFMIEGRHDACFALRTPVIVEAVTAIVLADLSRII